MGRAELPAADTEYHSLGKTSLCLTITGKGSPYPRGSQVPMGRVRWLAGDSDYHSLGKTSLCLTITGKGRAPRTPGVPRSRWAG